MRVEEEKKGEGGSGAQTRETGGNAPCQQTNPGLSHKIVAGRHSAPQGTKKWQPATKKNTRALSPIDEQTHAVARRALRGLARGKRLPSPTTRGPLRSSDPRGCGSSGQKKRGTNLLAPREISHSVLPCAIARFEGALLAPWCPTCFAAWGNRWKNKSPGFLTRHGNIRSPLYWNQPKQRCEHPTDSLYRTVDRQDRRSRGARRSLSQHGPVCTALPTGRKTAEGRSGH